MMHEEDDDETIFDQQGLLDVKRKKSRCDFFWYQRFTKTLVLSLAFFALGLCISIPGATLLDLKERTGTDVEKISIIFTARSLGYLVGSIFGGVLFDYYDQQILLFYTLVLTGIATIFVPWCTALTSLACMIASQGLAMGVLDTGGNMFCIRLWNKGSAPYMQVLHFSFAVGAFLAPLLARPFLLDKESIANHTFPQSHIPVNVHPSSLSSAMGPRSLHNHEVWWLETAASQQRALRDVSNSIESNYRQFPNIGNEYYDILKEDFGEQSEWASDGIHLKGEFASEQKANDHIISHKDDSRLPENNSDNGNAKSEAVKDVILWVTTTTTTKKAPRVAKPAASDGISLNIDFAEGEKAKDHIISHKDDSRLPENNSDNGKAKSEAVKDVIPWVTTTTTTTQAPRVAKPAASDGIHLYREFASEQKANDHIISHKDDSRLPENNSDNGKAKSEAVKDVILWVTTTTTTKKPPRVAKPAASDGIHLNIDFAEGEKAKDRIISHKDDSRPPEDNSENGKAKSESVKNDDILWFIITPDKQAPRPARPVASDGIHLNIDFAEGEKAKDYIISHKDDSRSPEDNSENGKAKLETVKYDDIFWLLHRAKRQSENLTITVSPIVIDNTSFVDTNGTHVDNIMTFATTATTTPAPRASKPSASDGVHLNKDFANGEKGNEHIISHKDDPKPQDDSIENGKAKLETITTENPGTSLPQNITYFDNVTVSGNVTDNEERSNNILENGSGIDSQKNTLAQTDVSKTVTIEASTTPTPKTEPSTTSASTTSTYTITNSTVGASNSSKTNSNFSFSTPVSTADQTKNPIDQNLTVNKISLLDNTTATVWAKATTTHPSKPLFNDDIISSTIEAVKNMSNIQFAYMIIGFVLIGNAAFFLLLYCRDCHARRLLHQVAALGPNPPPMSSCFRFSILCLLFIFFLFYVGMEVTFGGLVTTFAVESPLTLWTRQQGATLAALFWGSIAVGRGLAIFIARFFKPPCMLVADLTLMLTGAIMLSFSLQSSAAMLWVGTVTLGLGMSSVFPTAVSWADVYYPLTGRATAVFITGSGVGEMVIPVVTGYLFENYDSMCLMYIVLGFSCLVTAVFIVLQCIAWHNPLPASATKMGFVPLASEEENEIGMQDFDDAEIASSRSTGYTENARRRQPVKKFVEDAEEETSKLMDSSD